MLLVSEVSVRSDAVSMRKRRPVFVVVVFGDPYRGHGGERGEDGAADPHRVLPFRGRNDLHLDAGRHEAAYFTL